MGWALMADFPERRLDDGDLPSLFAAADRTSLSGQQRYTGAVIWRSWLAVAAAASGIAAWRVGSQRVDVLAIITMVILLALLLVEVYLRSSKPNGAWYDGRAVAESVKSLTWRYAVRASPFEELSDAQDKRFLNALEQLLKDVKLASPISAGTQSTISESVRTLRHSHAEVRKAVYVRDRIDDQREWYARKAAFNQKRASAWGIGLLVVEGMGIVAAFLKVIGVIDFDLAGVVAALIGVGATRLSLRQYSTNGRAYFFASEELSIARARLDSVDCTQPNADETWGAEAADAEEAISREHTMWRASRSRPE
ncbi:DUF4231 domain-containing protein [Kribbella koreensis]|uniref:DUF4231 domain-containing protein n=2 Tax=Kribbella koreensis TaxID=57909 RepID=A0ABN1QNP7_9ACTN